MVPEWSRRTIMRLVKLSMIPHRRPTPGRILISRLHALAIRQAANSNPAFWRLKKRARLAAIRH